MVQNEILHAVHAVYPELAPTLGQETWTQLKPVVDDLVERIQQSSTADEQRDMLSLRLLQILSRSPLVRERLRFAIVCYRLGCSQKSLPADLEEALKYFEPDYGGEEI